MRELAAVMRDTGRPLLPQCETAFSLYEGDFDGNVFGAIVRSFTAKNRLAKGRGRDENLSIGGFIKIKSCFQGMPAWRFVEREAQVILFAARQEDLWVNSNIYY